jgi:hypothetical protein
LEEFNATRDDLLLAFLKWAEKEIPTEDVTKTSTKGKSSASSSSSSFLKSFGRKNSKAGNDGGTVGSNEEDSSAPTEYTETAPTMTVKCNVSKATRRMDAYFKWMKDNRHEIYGPDGLNRLTFGSIKDAAKIWDIQITYDDDQKFVWWIDLAKLKDGESIKSLDPNHHLRYVVWFAHLVMFDDKARSNGAVIVEDLAHIGFWKLATLLPHELSVKMDRLTIGILPVKMKAIHVFGAAGWMHLLMNLMKPFMGQKMRQRMIMVPKSVDVQTYCERLVGGRHNIPQNVFGLEGDAPRDTVIEKFM